MTDILYGADLGAVASDLYGNIYAGLTLPVYSDKNGVSAFTLTKAANDDLSVGGNTAGQVTVNSVGRVCFYASDTDRTLWLKNGPYYWAVNPVSPSESLQYRIDSAVTSMNSTLDTFGQRITDVETSQDISDTSLRVALAYKFARVRLAAAKTVAPNTYTSLTLGVDAITNALFSLVRSSDALSPTLAGWFRVVARASFTADATGYRTLIVAVNSDSDTVSSTTAPSGIGTEENRITAGGSVVTTLTATEDFYLTPTSKLMAVVRHGSTGNLDVRADATRTTLSVIYLGTS